MQNYKSAAFIDDSDDEDEDADRAFFEKERMLREDMVRMAEERAGQIMAEMEAAAKAKANGPRTKVAGKGKAKRRRWRERRRRKRRKSGSVGATWIVRVGARARTNRHKERSRDYLVPEPYSILMKRRRKVILVEEAMDYLKL